MESTTPTAKPSKTSNLLHWVVLVVVLVIAIAGIVYAISRDEGIANTNENSNTNSNVNQNVNTTNVNSSANVNTEGLKIYKDTKYGYSFRYPSNWNLTTFNNNTPVPAVTSGAQSVCVTNFVQNIDTYHPQKDELQVCVNVYLNNNQSLDDWYLNYRKVNTTEIYSDIQTSKVTLDNESGIKETIITGTAPKKDVETEWLDGILESYYWIDGNYVIVLTATVTSDSAQLLQITKDIVNSISR